MPDAEYLIYNGALHSGDSFLLSPDNRSFRYGDGFFETMKMIRGKIILEDLHLERLFRSLQIMQFDKPAYFTPGYLTEQIQRLTTANKHRQLARVRLMVFRGNGGLNDLDNNEPNLLIQSWQLQGAPTYNEKGLRIAIYPDARKTADAFSAIKSNNYLPYVMAAMWSKQQGLDDALVMNCYDRLAEATTSNLFIVKDKVIQTPPLSEGCIAGVTRRYLLQCMRQAKLPVEETAITPAQVMAADELFLTNAGWHIQWVKQCGTKSYTNTMSKLLYQQFITSLAAPIHEE